MSYIYIYIYIYCYHKTICPIVIEFNHASADITLVSSVKIGRCDGKGRLNFHNAKAKLIVGSVADISARIRLSMVSHDPMLQESIDFITMGKIPSA